MHVHELDIAASAQRIAAELETLMIKAGFNARVRVEVSPLPNPADVQLVPETSE